MKLPFEIIHSRIAYKGFFQVREDTIERSNNTAHSHSSLVLPFDAAIVLAQNPEGLYILNHEYRHPTGKFLLGCPGGIVEPNEDPIQAAQRELLEETGYFSDEIYLTGSAYPFPGICNQKLYYFFAKNAKFKQNPKLDPLEMIETQLKTHEELISAIQTQSNIDAILCSALWFKERFEELLQPRESVLRHPREQ